MGLGFLELTPVKNVSALNELGAAALSRYAGQRHCQLEPFAGEGSARPAAGYAAAVAQRQFASASDRKTRSVDRETR
jgi:hypothetical protein